MGMSCSMNGINVGTSRLGSSFGRNMLQVTCFDVQFNTVERGNHVAVQHSCSNTTNCSIIAKFYQQQSDKVLSRAYYHR